ncbi:MAG: type IX secretion system outer membrane channel protein PorV [Rubricoccaceae bacterium]
MTLRTAAVLRTAVLLCAALAAPAAYAQVVLTTAVPFLQIEPDSRAAGMGMAGVALADNAAAPFWNPAGLAQQTGIEASFTHAPWLPALGADLSYEYLAGKYSFGDRGTLGAHLTYFNLGEQTWTDDQGNVIGNFRSFELSLGASYGYQLTQNLALGAGARFIYSNLTGGQGVGSTDTQAGRSFGLDVGALYSLPEFNVGVPVRTRLGLNLANMGPAIRYVADETGIPNAIPTNLRLGTSMTADLDAFNRLTWAIDFNRLLVDRDSTGQFKPWTTALFSSWKPRLVDTTPDGVDNPESVGVLRQFTVGTGLEYWYNDLLALRSGFFYEDPANGNRKFVTFGAGIRYSLFGFDMSYIYSLEERSPLEDQIRFSLLLNLPR